MNGQMRQEHSGYLLFAANAICLLCSLLPNVSLGAVFGEQVIQNATSAPVSQALPSSAAPITSLPISLAISPDRPNYMWRGDNPGSTCGKVSIDVNFGEVIETAAPKLLGATFGSVGVARTAEQEEKAKASGLLITIDITRVSAKWRWASLFDTSFDSTFELSVSILSGEKKIWTNSYLDTETFPGKFRIQCEDLMKDAYSDMTLHLIRVLKKAHTSLPSDKKLLIAIDEAEQEINPPAVDILAGLNLIEARYRVSEADSAIRKRPDSKSPLVRKVGVGSILQIIGQLPNGWLQVAKEGEPIGWIQESSVVAINAPPSPAPAVTQAASATSTPSATAAFPINPMAVAFARSRPNSDDIAVIIGSANYKATAKDIPDAVPAYADAEGMKRYATQALGIKEENIILIKDARLADLIATFGNESNPKGKLWNWVKPNRSQVFIYYSGHGAPSGDGASSYLVPVDATASLIDLSGYSLKTLYANLGKLPAKSVTVVLEACFSGATQAGMLVKNASPIYQKALQEIVPTNITVISAGSGNQIASWEQDKSHGLFTKHFLLGMAGAADKKPYGNGDGKVTSEELSRYLAETVSYSAQRYYGRAQTVQIVNAWK